MKNSIYPVTIQSTQRIYDLINNSKLTPKQKIKSLLFLNWFIIEPQVKKLQYKSIPQSFFVKRFGNHYNIWFNKLKELDIIQTLLNNNNKEIYSTDIGFSKSYKLNNNLNPYSLLTYQAPIIITTIKVKHPKKGYIMNKNINDIQIKSNKNMKLITIEQQTIKYLNKLTVNIEKLNNIKDKKVKDIENKLKIVGVHLPTVYNIRYFDINDGLFNLSRDYYMNGTSIFIKICEGYELLEYKNNYYLTKDKASLLLFLQNQTNLSYTITINKFINKDFFAHRNNTNNRLDSNITSLASELTKEILTENDLIEFDLFNSQMAIFSHLYPEIEKSFISHSNEGTLYEYMIKQFGSDNRLNAKKMMFILMFSKNEHFTEEKEILSKIFPLVVEKAKEIKNENHNTLAILLQQFESKLFLDIILKKIYKLKIFALSKHDSIICKKEDSDKVYNIIIEEFNKINFNGKI